MPTDPAPSDSTPDSPEVAPLRRWGRRLLWGLGGLVGSVVALLGLALLVLQTETGATATAQFLARQANPLPQTTLTVERASGNWVRSLRLTNVSLTRPDSGATDSVTMAHVDTLAVRYRLGALLGGRLHLTDVSLKGPSVSLRQAPDSTWDWARHLPASESAPNDTSAGLPIQVDALSLVDGAFAAHFYAAGRDSTARLRTLTLQTRDVRYGATMGGRLDTLGLRARLPTDTTDLRLAARGELSAREVTLDTLRLTSPRSNVSGAGTARLPLSPSDSLDDVAFSLHAAPLALGDLTAFAPALDVNPEEALDARFRLTGSGRRLSLTSRVSVRDGGGQLTATASATPYTTRPPGAPPLKYRFDVESQRFTSSLIGPSNTAENSITARLKGALSGPALDSLDGTLTATVSDTRLYGLQAADASLTSTVENGTATLNLEGRLNGIGASVAGTARPLDDAPSMDLEARVQDLALHTVAPAAGIDGSVTGSARLQGRALATDSASYDASVRLRNSRVGAQPIDTGQFTVALRPTRARATGAVRFPTGQLRASGQAALDDSEKFSLDSLRLENVNVAALMGDTTESRVTATLTGRGQGFSPASMNGRATLTVQEAQYGPHQLSALTSTAQLRDGRVTTEASAQLNGSNWTLAANARPFAARPAVELTKGRFQHLDIGPFLQDTTQSSALHGTLQGRLEGTDPESLVLDTRITVDTSRVNRQAVQAASLDARLAAGALQSTLSLRTPKGTAQLPLRGRPLDETPSLEIPEGRFENLNVGAFAGLPSLSTSLSGGLTLRAQGARLPELSLQSELTLQSSTINRAAVDGRLSFDTEQGAMTTTGDVAVAGGSVRLRGRLDSLSGTPTYALQTTARSLDLSALAGLDSTRSQLQRARWTVEGRGTGLDSLTASTRFSADSLRLNDVRVHALKAAGAVEQGLLHVDTLTVQSNVLSGQGQGPLAVIQGTGTSDFDFSAALTDAAPLRSLSGMPALQLRTGQVTTHVYGPPEAQQFDGTVELDGLIYEDVRVSDATASFSGRRGAGPSVDRLRMDADIGYVSAYAFTADRTRLEASYDGQTLDLSTNVRLDPERRFQVETGIRPTADSTEVRIRQFSARLGPDQWSLLRPTSITVGDAYRVEQLLLESGPQRIEADGVVDPEGAQDFRAALEEVRLRGIAPLLGLSGLDGTATGTVRLTGDASAPVLDGALDLGLRSEDRAVGTLRLDVGYEALAVTLDARLAHEDGSVLTVDGSVPADLRLQTSSPANTADRPVALDASTEGFPLNWLDPFFDPATVESVTGTLTADARVRGTLGSPELSGSASVTDAGAHLPPINTTYRDGSAEVRLSSNRLTLEQARVRTSNDGALEAEGLITLPELTVGEYDLTLNASDFLAINTSAYRRAIIDGDMRLQGTVRRPVLSGGVQVQGGSVYYAEALSESTAAMGAVTLTSQDQLTLEERFGLRLTAADTTTFDAYEAMALDLTVQIQSNTWLRSTSNPEMNMQFTGDLDVQKSPFEDPRVFGTVSVLERRSTLRQFGQEFEITEGTLTFNGDPFTPYLDLTAVYDKRARGTQGSEVRITLSLSGRPDNLTPSLSSEPTMSTRNIFSYLATGRPADALFSGSSEGGSLATQVALGQASNFVENLAASELGLDVVRLDVRTEGTSYLTVGRYLTPRFFASVEQPVLAPSSQTTTQSTALIPDVTLEYQLNNYLQLRSRTNQQSLQLNLLFEYAY